MAQAMRSDIQLSAPGSSKLLNAPAFAPTSDSLPAGVVSLAAKKNSNGAATASGQDDQQSFTYTTMPVHTSPAHLHSVKASACMTDLLLYPGHMLGLWKPLAQHRRDAACRLGMCICRLQTAQASSQ